MGKIIACCGHEVRGDDAFKGYYWKQWSREYQPELSYGSLCPKCVVVYGAVEARSLGEAKRLLKDIRPVDLMDIREVNCGLSKR